MRLVGCTRNVPRVCNEHFSWAGGGGLVERLRPAFESWLEYTAGNN